MKRQFIRRFAIVLLAALIGYFSYRVALHSVRAGHRLSFGLGMDVFLASGIFFSRLRDRGVVAALSKACAVFMLAALLVALGWAFYRICLLLADNWVPIVSWAAVIAGTWAVLYRQRKITSDRSWFWILTGVGALLHLMMALAMGAKYWYDSIIYVELAEHIFDFAGLKSLYDGQYGLLFQHIVPGLPAEIAIFAELFGRQTWIAIAIFQNGLNVFASAYFVTGFSGRINRGYQLLALLLTALFPYYAAFHGAILTESVSASIMLFIVGATLRGFDGRLSLTRAVIIVLMLGFVGGQFRSYLVCAGAGCACILIFDKVRFSRPMLYVASIAVFVASVVAFPLYRTAAGVRFFLPNNNPWLLEYGSDVSWDLNGYSQHALNGVVFEPQIRHKLIDSHESLNIYDNIKIADDLSERGVSRAEIGNRIARASLVVRLQSWQTIERQLQLTLQSIGFEWAAICCNGQREVLRGTTNAAQLEHIQYYWRWNAGLDNGNYLAVFDNETKDYRAHPALYGKSAIERYVDWVRPHVYPKTNGWRDPLWLGGIPGDVLIALAVVGLAIMARRDWRIWAIVALLIAPVYVAALTALAEGDNRHAHLLFPLYFIGIAALAETAFSAVVRGLRE